MRATYEATEHRRASETSHGWDWVPDYFRSLQVRPRSLEKYATNWNWVRMWLDNAMLAVGKVEYAHVERYIAWRLAQQKPGGKKAGRNTAIQEVKLLAFVLNEAVRRNMIKASPLASLRRIRSEAVKKKPEFTDEQITQCQEGLTKEAEWMQTAFNIGLATGCRLRETRINLDYVDISNPRFPVLTFGEPKGGSSFAFSILVPTTLMPMFLQMKSERRAWTIDKFPAQPSRAFTAFFKKMGMPQMCFHCLRVTKVTRLRREGVPREVAMRLVNHSHELTHMIYDRHQVRDLEQYRDAGKVPVACGAKARSRTNGHARPPKEIPSIPKFAWQPHNPPRPRA